MMNRILISLPCMLLLLTACVQEIEPPVSGQQQIAVSCVLTDSEVQTLRLTYSKPPQSGMLFDEVAEATATLYEEEQTVGVFEKTGYAEWSLNFHPRAGRKYRLEVEVPDRPTFSATTTMPEKAPIKPAGITDEGYTKLFTQQRLKQPVWMFCLDSSLTDVAYYFRHPQPDDDSRITLFQQLGTDHKHADRFNQNGSASEFIDQYAKTLAYFHYVRIYPDSEGNGEDSYTFNVQHPLSGASFVVFRSASNEYDRYLKSIIEKKQFYEDSDDPVRWFEESVIYSNIENGVGIFGAYVQTAYYYNNKVKPVRP